MFTNDTASENISREGCLNAKETKSIVFQSTETIPSVIDETSLSEVILSNIYRSIPEEKIVYVDAKHPGTRLTFGELKKQSFICATSFKEEYGLKPGDVIAVCSPNIIQHPVIFLGALAAGCIFAPMRCSALSTPEETAQDLETIRPKLLILHHTELKHTFESAKKAGIPESHILMFKGPSETALRTIDDILESNEPATDYYHYSKEEVSDVPCCLYFTSGSTGQRKAVRISQRSLLCNLFVAGIESASSLDSIITLSVSFISVLVTGLVYPMYTGSTAYILDRDNPPLDDVLKLVEKYKISRLTTPPLMAKRLISDHVLMKKYDLSSLKHMAVGGAHVDKTLCQAFVENSSIKLVNAYGMTECLGLAQGTPEMSLLGSAGSLNFGASVRIVDKNGNDCTAGEPGELRIKGPTVTKGYYRNSEATRELFDEQGYMKTGDICKIDENMLVYHIARLKELIKLETTEIYPIQIEKILFTHPSVADCAVVGVLQKAKGVEYPRAYVTLADGVEGTEAVLKEIQDYTDTRLTESKRLRGGVFEMKEFERTGSGKIQKFKLRQWANNEVNLNPIGIDFNNKSAF
ncbi:hypothetical protein BY458DRAFT_460818 [Sporodiniella umbellata]|nr:hypothetical protein BY458DRAFT_460818 [Sporodiniella umbellata]